MEGRLCEPCVLSPPCDVTSVAFPGEIVFFFHNPNYISKSDFHITHQLLLNMLVWMQKACRVWTEKRSRVLFLWTCEGVEKEMGTGGEPHFCCNVYEMLTSQRWVDDKQCCPVGIEIYLSQVTPIGNKQLDSSLCHSHTLLSTAVTHTYSSEHAHRYCDVYVCQVWRLL